MSKFRCEVSNEDYLSVDDNVDGDCVEFNTKTKYGYGVFLTSSEIRRLRKKLKKLLIAIEGNETDRNGDNQE